MDLITIPSKDHEQVVETRDVERVLRFGRPVPRTALQQISIARANSSLLLAECGVEGGDLQPEQVVGACRRASYGESSIRGVRLLNGCSDKLLIRRSPSSTGRLQ